MKWPTLRRLAPMGISFFIPSNRVHRNGKPTHMDGWNEFIKAVNVNRYAGNAREQENVRHVEQWARAAMVQARLKPPERRARLFVTFVEVNRRRDVANVYGGLKWLLDGLSRPRGTKRRGAGLIVDDSCKWVDVRTAVDYDPARPGVRVVCEYEGEK